MGHIAKMTAVIMDSFESNEHTKNVISGLEIYDKFKEFYEEKWKQYNANSTQLLVGSLHSFIFIIVLRKSCVYM